MTDLLLVSMSEIKESAFVTLSGGTERVFQSESMVMPKKISDVVRGHFCLQTVGGLFGCKFPPLGGERLVPGCEIAGLEA